MDLEGIKTSEWITIAATIVLSAALGNMLPPLVILGMNISAAGYAISRGLKKKAV